MKWYVRLHPLFHRPGVTEACWICRMVWRRLERDPAFNETMEAATADLLAGRGTKWSDIRRED